MIKETDKKEKELLDLISDLEFKIKKLKDHKRYGLVWENKIEKFDKESKDALPILREKGDKYPDIITDKNEDFNILIEGDNYHSLSVLSYTHKNKIDVVYIDPPYNTGKKDFIYNDHYVDIEDRFRHSKWLSFMSKRLKLAKTLLKKDGVIFISIDDNELAQLKLLCDEIFDGKNCLAIISWQSTDTLRNDARWFSGNSEYILCYAKKKELAKIKGIIKGEKQHAYYKNDDKDGKGAYLLTPLHAKSGSETGLYEYKFKNGQIWSPPKGTFPRFSKSTLARMEQEGRIWLHPDGKKVPQRKTYLSEVGERMPLWTFWRYEDFGSTRQSNQELSEILGKGVFQNPKPTKLIKLIIDAVAEKDAVIADFFAGSGTTGHAVLDLNKDGGNRKFILCTNNENKICEDITYERLKRVSIGYKNSEGKKIKGLGENLKYLKTGFVKLEKSVDTLKHKIVEGSTEILCLKEGTFNLVSDSYKKNRAKIFQNKDKYTAILFDLFYFEDFVEQLKKLTDKPVSVYVFSYTKDFSKKEFGDLDIKFTIEPIPEKILETYKKIFNF